MSKVIKLGSIKIAEKENAKISLTDYGSFKGKNDKGALSAVYQALHLNFTQDFVGKIVITEGVTDLYFFEMLSKFTKLITNNFKIIPGAGSGNSSHLISIGLSFSENFVLLFDNDGGAKAIKKYVDEFGEEITRYFHKYSTKENFALEDFLSKADTLRLKNLVDTKDSKKALALLYYDFDDSYKKEFFKNLDNDSLTRLKETVQRLNEL